MKNTNLFTIFTKILVILMPFYVFLAVFLSNITWFSSIGFFFKEFLIILLIWSLIFEFYKAKKIPKLDLLDYLIFFFIFYGIWITFINWLGFSSVIYGWRYDFMFLIVFLIYKHWKIFLKIKISELLKLFLYSASLSLFLGLLVKFVLWEEVLTIFWYTNYISDWTYKWWVPNYHWLENSWIRRFQWILEWPNPMAFFLIIFTSLFLAFQKNKQEFYVFLILVFLFFLLILTFSRSAILWVFTNIFIIFLLNIKIIWKKYKKLFLSFSIFLLIFSVLFWFLFQENIKNIIIRKGSTSGHFERMIVWIKRFTEKPFWAGLAESGPAFRKIYPEKQTKKDELKYIPESWFIQILIEWWIIYFLLYLSIISIILRKLYKNNLSIFFGFSAILVMSLFLHIFEATYLSIIIFSFIWLFLNKD